MIKILKRNATFEEKDLSGGPPAAQNTRLNVPKKTKLFVDQTMRERENAVSMYQGGVTLSLYLLSREVTLSLHSLSKGETPPLYQLLSL